MSPACQYQTLGPTLPPFTVTHQDSPLGAWHPFLLLSVLGLATWGLVLPSPTQHAGIGSQDPGTTLSHQDWSPGTWHHPPFPLQHTRIGPQMPGATSSSPTILGLGPGAQSRLCLTLCTGIRRLVQCTEPGAPRRWGVVPLLSCH